MSVVRRDREVRAARSKATVQALYRSELREAGEARRAAMAEAEWQLERIGKFLAGATAAGLSLSEVARITGMSRPTLYELLKRGERTGDARFDLLAALAAGGSLRLADLVEGLARPESFAKRLVRALVAQGLVAAVGEDGGATEYELTVPGEEALLSWEFGAGLDERASKPARAAMALFRYSPDELAEIEDKMALAAAQGQSRFTLVEAVRMGVKATLDEFVVAPAEKRRTAHRSGER
jgi:transcriptional regulator with XRE-family HTH domain